MLRLARWLVGYVTFTFRGGFCEGFINTCVQRRLALSCVHVADGVLTAECPALLYPLLRPAARENGGRLRIVKRYGLPFKLRPLKNRWGLFAGVVVCMGMVGFFSGFIWQVEVTGCETLDPTSVQRFLAENGFHEGIHRRAAEENYYESLLMAVYDECAWVHINYEGTTAVVEISESTPKPTVAEDTAPADVTALKSGTVVKMTVHSGWQQVEEGEGVVKGDVLIAGSYDSEAAETTLFTHADGIVIADVREPFSLTVSRYQPYKVPQSPTVRYSLLFFGWTIPLYIGAPAAEDADVTQVYEYQELNGRRLPIGRRVTTITPYTVEERTLSDSELEALAAAEQEKAIAAVFSDAEVLSRQLTTTLGAENATVSGTLLCRESIGVSTPLPETEKENVTEEP